MKDSYGRYKEARNASWQCLVDFKVSELPVSVSKLLRKCKVSIGTYLGNAEQLREEGLGYLMKNDGFTLRDSRGRFFVYYNDKLPPERIRFTLAHELGHIFLGHVMTPAPNGSAVTVLNRGPSEDNHDPLETDANVFASRLLAPACVLWKLNIHDANDIARLCGISHEAAEIRADRMERLYRREQDWLKTAGSPAS